MVIARYYPAPRYFHGCRRYYLRDGDGFECLVCGRAFPSYPAIVRHQFQGPQPCVLIAVSQPLPTYPVAGLAYAGTRTDVPLEPTAPEDLPEHRDALGRLRVRGTLVGYRRWQIGRVDGEHRLFPLVLGENIPFGRGVMTAGCAAPTPNGQTHPAPAAYCGCGYHAYWDRREVTRQPTSAERHLIGGRVKGFGVVRPGRRGWRAQHVIVDAIHTPICVEHGCGAVSTRGVVRPRWLRPMTPRGNTYPRFNSARFATYRDTADFAAGDFTSSYVGWFCDDHGSAEFCDLGYRARCGLVRRPDRACQRTARMALKDVPYSWCYEHAPIILDTAAVMRDLRAHYDVVDEEVS